MNDMSVPLALVALELGIESTELASRLNGQIEIDPSGIRCISADVCRRLIADHEAHRAAAAEWRRAQQARTSQRCAALRAANTRGGVPLDDSVGPLGSLLSPDAGRSISYDQKSFGRG